MYICICTYIYAYKYMYMYMYIHKYTYTYTCIHIYINTYTSHTTSPQDWLKKADNVSSVTTLQIFLTYTVVFNSTFPHLVTSPPLPLPPPSALSPLPPPPPSCAGTDLACVFMSVCVREDTDPASASTLKQISAGAARASVSFSPVAVGGTRTACAK